MKETLKTNLTLFDIFEIIPKLIFKVTIMNWQFYKMFLKMLIHTGAI